MSCRSTEGVLLVGGPTASGKTALAVRLAHRYGAEIVGADSRQIYRDMPIGTAAPTADERAAVPHHLVGFLDPYERYSAARFVVDASAAIAAIRARGGRAIVVGGTGFYLRALCGDVALADEPNAALRARLLREARLHPPEILHAWLAARNPARAAQLAPFDGYRTVRALEVELAPRRDAPRARALPTLRAGGLAYAKIVLAVDAATLDARIARRVDEMLATGLLDEAERVGPDAIAADAVGYREALMYLAGWSTAQELRTGLARATRRYAKRQGTWFRAEPDAVVVDPADTERIDAVVATLGWYAPHVRRQPPRENRCPNGHRFAMASRPPALQDAYLSEIRRQGVQVTVYLVNGFQLRGTVKGFDPFTIVLDYEHRSHLIYKHAVSTISPQGPLVAPLVPEAETAPT